MWLVQLLPEKAAGEGGLDSWESLSALWIMNPGHSLCSCPSLNLSVRTPSIEQCFKLWLAPEQPEATYADSSEVCWRCWWAGAGWEGGWESSLLWGYQPGMAGSQQWSLQAHHSVLHSLQVLSDTVLTYFTEKQLQHEGPRDAGTNSCVVLSIYSEVWQAALVFSQKKEN